MKKISFIKENCAGCNICSIACMDQNDYDPSCGESAFRTAGRREKNGVFESFSESCFHCGACIDVCPLECIKRDEETGFVTVDNSGCIGCGACRDICPVSAPKIISGRMVKCDGCNERVKAGMLPACVRACPTGALVFVE